MSPELTADTPFPLLEATIESIHGAMASGQLTCRGLVQMYLDRIEAYDKVEPALNSIQARNPAALDQAERLDERFRRSGSIGPLHGIPVVVKDQVETSDMPTTYGSALFRDFRPQRDATVVQRLKAAGAIILAKTTMGEFAAGYAGSAFGVCRNAYDRTRNPAGSSCGTAVSVTCNFAAAGIGEDGLGSIRGPAAFGSLVGLRPTLPLVSRWGVLPETPSRDTIGPITRTVADAAIILNVIAGYDPSDVITAASVGEIPSSYRGLLTQDGLRGLRLGVIQEPMARDADPQAEDFRQVRAVIHQALQDLASAGAHVVGEVSIPSLSDLLQRCMGSFEREAAMDKYFADLPDAPVRSLRELILSPQVLANRRANLLGALGGTPDDPGHLQQLLARSELRQSVLKVMADSGLDALVYATFDHPPALIPEDVLTSPAPVTQPGNNRILSPMVGFPALSVPAGFTSGGLPVGIEFLGRPWAEGLLLRLAYGYEQATGRRRPPAPTPALSAEPSGAMHLGGIHGAA